MDRKEIEEKVKEILSEELGIKREAITPEKRLIEDLGMDSFKAIELMFEIEDKFNIEIKEDDMKNIKRVRDAVKYIEERMD